MLSLDDVNARLDRFMAKKRAERGRYTLRDLSKEIGYSIQQISDVRRGRRTLKSDFVERVKAATEVRPEDHVSLTTQQLAVTQDVVHYHILSLSRLPGARADAQWIASRLGIDVARAQACFDRLLGQGLVRVVGDRYEQTHANFTTAGSASKELMRPRYLQHSELAFRAFDTEPPEARFFQARTFAIAASKLEIARAIVRRTLAELDALEDEDAERVYTCLVQFFPVSTTEVAHEPN